MAQSKELKRGDVVTITRLEVNGYTDEGEVITSSPDKIYVKITKSDTKDVIRKKICFGFISGVWKYINASTSTFSQRDPGYEISKKE